MTVNSIDCDFETYTVEKFIGGGRKKISNIYRDPTQQD